MVYQALLFSTDEKASRAVTQILSELEFQVEVCAEPFAAVKQITNRHYDAIVVDCDNEQNATLLFKSARNSSSNSGSLAVALVHGQGGIAKAFRIGANLVLTKPIHVEQSKGTLRTAKGLLRKAEAAKANSAATSVAKPTETPVPPPSLSPLSVHPEFSVGPVASGALELQEEQFPKLEPAEVALLESMPEPVPVQASSASSELQTHAAPGMAVSPAEPVAIQTLTGKGGVAAAPAKANEPLAADAVADKPAPERRKGLSVAGNKAAESPSSRREAFVKPTRAEDEPAFGETPPPDDIQPRPTGNRKNFWIAVVLVLASAGAFNYGWPLLRPFLISLPLVQKYFAPQQSSHPAPAPAVLGTRAAGAPSAGSATQTGSADVASQAPTPVTDNSATSSSSPAASGNPADKAASPSSVEAVADQHPLHLAPADAAGLLREKVDPTYPPSALQQKIEGSVELQANIGKDGTTSHLKVLSGKPRLASAAAAAVRQWKYQPYEVNGQPTEVQTEITVDFKLPQP